jgi:hypothetical protein
MNKIDWSKAPAGAIDRRKSPEGIPFFTNGKQYWSITHLCWKGNVSDWQIIETRYAHPPYVPSPDPLGGHYWGVEYQVEGMKLTIARDVLVGFTCADGYKGELEFSDLNWGRTSNPIKTIRIIDPRYAPTAPSAPAIPPVPTEPDWFDWDKEVAVNWPPEGTKCEYWTGSGYVTLKVMAVRDKAAWLCNVDDGRDAISSDFTDIRPVDYAKTIHRMKLMEVIKTDAPGITDEVAEILIKSGWEKRSV